MNLWFSSRWYLRAGENPYAIWWSTLSLRSAPNVVRDMETEAQRERKKRDRKELNTDKVLESVVHLQVVQGVRQQSVDDVKQRVPLWLGALRVDAEGAQATHHLGVLPEQST